MVSFLRNSNVLTTPTKSVSQKITPTTTTTKVTYEYDKSDYTSGPQKKPVKQPVQSVISKAPALTNQAFNNTAAPVYNPEVYGPTFETFVQPPPPQVSIEWPQWKAGPIRSIVLPSALLPQNVNELKTNEFINVQKFNEQNLQGIIKEQPVILMLASFEPLKIADAGRYLNVTGNQSNLTAAGEYFFAQQNVNDLKVQKNFLMLEQLSKLEPISAELSARTRDVNLAIELLRDYTGCLTNLVAVAEEQKTWFDVRSRFTNVSNDDVKQFLVQSFRYNDSDLKSYSSTKIWLQSLIESKEVLLKHSSFLANASETFEYSDDLALLDKEFKTKKFFFGLGLKSIVSPKIQAGFKTLPTVNRRTGRQIEQEEIPVVLTGPTLNENFEIVMPDGRLAVPEVSNIINMNPNELTVLYDSLRGAFNAMNEYLESDASRIAVLLNAVSKELLYSTALKSKSFNDSLKLFGYTTDDSSSNGTLLDFVFGEFGQSIYDFEEQNVKQSLLSVTHNVSANSDLVLTLENSFLQSDKGTTIPGSAYYVESLFDVSVASGRVQFDTAKLDDLYNRIVSLKKSFVAHKNALMSVSANKETDTSLFKQSQFFQQMHEDFVNLRSFQDGNSKFLLKANAYCAILFNIAVKDNHLKSMMFALFVAQFLQDYRSEIDSKAPQTIEDYSTNFTTTAGSQASYEDALRTNPAEVQRIDSQRDVQRVYDNSSLMSKLIDDIIQYVSNYSRQNNDAISDSIRLYSIQQCRDDLKNFASTTIFTFVKNYFSKFLFVLKNQALISSSKPYTKFSGSIDTFVLMAAFECLMTYVDSAMNLHYKGITITQENGVSITNLTIEQPTSNVILSRSLTTLRDSITNLLKNEEKLVSSIFQFYVDFLTNMQSQIEKTRLTFTDKTTIDKVTSIYSRINNLDTFRQLMSQQQITLLKNWLNNIDFAVASNKLNGRKYGAIDSTFDNTTLNEVASTILSNHEFTVKSSLNQKIVSFAVPRQLAKNLQRKIDNRTRLVARDSKQNDVIKATLYRKNMQLPDLLYKPLEFYYELSRFPDLSSEHYSKLVNSDMRYELIPTLNVENGSVSVQTRSNLNSTQYDFLSSEQKDNLYKNHVLDFALQRYVKTMCGFDVSEQSFKDTKYDAFLTQNFVELLFRGSLLILTNRTSSPQVGGVLTTNSIQSANRLSTVTLPELDSLLDDVGENQIDDVLSVASTIDELLRTQTNVTDPTIMIERFLTPSKFDRSFSLIFDPDSFEIDTENLSESGKLVFNQLLQSGEIEAINKQYSTNDLTVSYKEKDKGSDDFSIDQYFVTISTVNSEIV